MAMNGLQLTSSRSGFLAWEFIKSIVPTFICVPVSCDHDIHFKGATSELQGYRSDVEVRTLGKWCKRITSIWRRLQEVPTCLEQGLHPHFLSSLRQVCNKSNRWSCDLMLFTLLNEFLNRLSIRLGQGGWPTRTEDHKVNIHPASCGSSFAQWTGFKDAGHSDRQSLLGREMVENEDRIHGIERWEKRNDSENWTR